MFHGGQVSILTHCFAPMRNVSRVPVQERHGQDEVDGNASISSQVRISIEQKEKEMTHKQIGTDLRRGGIRTWPCTQSSGRGLRSRTGGATGSTGPGMRHGRSRARRRGGGPPSGTACPSWPRQSARGRGRTAGLGPMQLSVSGLPSVIFSSSPSFATKFQAPPPLWSE